MNEITQIDEKNIEILPHSAMANMPLQKRLSADVEAFEETLVETIVQASEIKRESDGLFLGLGADAFLGFIPVVGALYSAWRGFGLLILAQNSHATTEAKVTGCALFAFDIFIGLWIAVGDILDALFRSHAMFANKIIGQAEEKLRYIQYAREIGEEQGGFTEADITEIRDYLFRNGKSQLVSNIPLIFAGGIFAIYLFNKLIG